MISVTLYTLMMLSFDHARPAPGLLPPACHRVTRPGRRCRQVIAESADPGGWPSGFSGDRGAGSSAAPAMIVALSERSVMPPTGRRRRLPGVL
jgi:hypothetical protein